MGGQVEIQHLFWSAGVLEYWKLPGVINKFNTPILHYSSVRRIVLKVFFHKMHKIYK